MFALSFLCCESRLLLLLFSFFLLLFLVGLLLELGFYSFLVLLFERLVDVLQNVLDLLIQASEAVLAEQAVQAMNLVGG